MTYRVFTATGVAILAVTVAGHARQAQTQERADIDAFVRLSPDERFDYWNRTTPEVRSQLQQAHVRAWVAANSDRLNSRQVATLNEAVALLTPELHAGNPERPEVVALEAELHKKLFCTLWRSDVVAALNTLGTSIPAVSWRENVSTWVRKCYLGA